MSHRPSNRAGRHRPSRSDRHPRERARAEVVPADPIAPRKLNKDARRIVKLLQKHGHEAYLVGGCVRDLMIGIDPKDFDVATSATPQEIRRLFRNGRIIGRRFKLVHIYYGNHTIETSTFRSDPGSDQPGRADGLVDEDDLLILEDNVFGTAAEDARRRDFTVNALFLDPETHRIHDYVGGLEDLEERVLRTIGDPRIRMAEDPVRILRAIKFATRLGFRIDDATWEAMEDVAPQLSRSASPRVLEEILRLMRSGSAQGAVKMLRACGALETILPQLDDYLGPRASRRPADQERADKFLALLEALDARVNNSGYVPTTPVCIAVLFLPLIEREADPEQRRGRGEPGTLSDVAFEILEPLAMGARLSRRDFGRARRIIADQERFTAPPGKRFSPLLFARSEEFPEALELFGIRTDARGQGSEFLRGWRSRYREAMEASHEELEAERRRTKRRRRRRRRPRRQGGSGDE